MNVAGIDRLEAGIEWALPDGLQSNGLSSGTAPTVDVSQKALSGKRFRLDRDGFTSEIIGDPVSVDGLYPDGFEDDHRRAIMRHGGEGTRPVTGLGPCRTGGQDRKGNKDDDQMRSSHEGIVI